MHVVNKWFVEKPELWSFWSLVYAATDYSVNVVPCTMKVQYKEGGVNIYITYIYLFIQNTPGVEPRHPPIPPSIRILTRSFTPVIEDFCRESTSDWSSLFSNRCQPFYILFCFYYFPRIPYSPCPVSTFFSLFTFLSLNIFYSLFIVLSLSTTLS